MTDQLARFDDAALETALRSLATSIDWPTAVPMTPGGATAGPDVATRVRARLVAGERPRTRRSWWDLRGRPVSRALVLAIVALLALAIAAGAIGLRLPGLRFIFGEPPPSAVPSPTAPAVVSPGASATVRPTATPTPTLPPIAGMKLGLGQQVSLDEVEGLTGVPVQLPVDDRLGPPDAVWVDRGKANQIAYVWAADADLPETSEPGVGLVFMRFGGRTDDGFYEKVIGSGTHITRVEVGGNDGWWIDGDMHFFFYQDPNGRFVDDGRRWVGDALVWTDGTTTYRIESQLGRDATIALAESIR